MTAVIERGVGGPSLQTFTALRPELHLEVGAQRGVPLRVSDMTEVLRTHFMTFAGVG